MKKIIVALSLCAVSAVSMAASSAICTTGTGSQVAGGTDFVKSSFTPKCSANTSVAFDQSANSAAVGAISTKGNQIFGGHTNGGAVAKLSTGGDCAASGCVAGDATTAADTMLTASSS